MSQEVKVKKIKAYPICAKLSMANGIDYQINIAKLENIGFYVESEDIVLATGARGVVSFQLPLQRILINAKVILVRSVDSYVRPGADKSEIIRLLEFHFQNLTKEASNRINTFKKEIGQK